VRGCRPFDGRRCDLRRSGTTTGFVQRDDLCSSDGAAEKIESDRIAQAIPQRKATTPSVKGSASVGPQEAKAIFYNTSEAAAQDEAVALLCAQPIRPSFSSVGWTDERLGSVPKHYIECTEDQAVFINDQRALQSHMRFSRIETLTCDHSPFWSMPERLAGVIDGLLMG